MTAVISAFQWVVANWGLIQSILGPHPTVVLFFLHGNAKSEVQELRDFIASVQLSQAPQPSAQDSARLADPKK